MICLHAVLLRWKFSKLYLLLLRGSKKALNISIRASSCKRAAQCVDQFLTIDCIWTFTYSRISWKSRIFNGQSSWICISHFKNIWLPPQRTLEMLWSYFLLPFSDQYIMQEAWRANPYVQEEGLDRSFLKNHVWAYCTVKEQFEPIIIRIFTRFELGLMLALSVRSMLSSITSLLEALTVVLHPWSCFQN